MTTISKLTKQKRLKILIYNYFHSKINLMTQTVTKSVLKRTSMLQEIRWKRSSKKSLLFKSRCTIKKRSFHRGRLSMNTKFTLLMLKLKYTREKLSKWKKSSKTQKMTYKCLRELGIASRLNSWSSKRLIKTWKHSSNRLRASCNLLLTLRRRIRSLLNKKCSWWEKSKDSYRTTEKRKGQMAIDYID